MGDNPDDLPYRAEYAKSGRAKCKGCKADIPKGDMRLASMTQVGSVEKQIYIEHFFCSRHFSMVSKPIGSTATVSSPVTDQQPWGRLPTLIL